MNLRLLLRTGVLALTVVVTAGMFSGTAQARPDPDVPSMPRAGDVAAARALAPCGPAPTATDAALAGQLNTTLRAKMRGFMSAYRVSCARMVIKAVKNRGLHDRAAVIAITTTIVESSIDNIAEELDHDSLGLFQQRASWGSVAQRLDPTWATNAFLNKMLSVYPNNRWLTAPIGEICQAVQVSAFPDRYQPQAGDAQIIVNTLLPHLDPVPVDNGTVQFADLSGDGRDELIAIAPNGDVRAYLNLGWEPTNTYTGSANKVVAKGFTNPGATKFGDLNGDGRAEIIAIAPNGDVRAYLNLGWEPTDTFTGSANKVVARGFTVPVATKFADINGDDRDEILSMSGGDVRAYLNLGWEVTDTYTGSASKLVAQGFTNPVATKFADLNGDNRAEIIAISPNGDVRAYLNLGWEPTNTYTGSANKLVAQGFTNPVATKFGDLNGDNRDEIITIDGNGGVRAYLNLGWEPANTYTGSANKLIAQGFRI